MVTNPEFYMQLCLNEAWRYQALTYPNPPVGALIQDPFGKILAISAHHRAKEAHAELLACIEVVVQWGDKKILSLPSPSAQHNYLIQKYANRFQNHTIYVTLEPCMHQGSTPPCSLLLKSLGFRKVVIATTDPNPNAKGGAVYLKEKKIEVILGILEKKAKALLYPFFKWQQNKPFVFFKLAKHQNGVYTGKHVSSPASRTQVHAIRSKIDLLVIGGDTVRKDRPTLDCRLLKHHSKAPDIMIFTTHDDIDRKIPLFQVPNRKVFVSSTLDPIQNYRHVMIEGAQGMMQQTKNIVDYYLFFTSPHFKEGKTIQISHNLESLHSYNNSFDTIEWFKNMTKETN